MPATYVHTGNLGLEIDLLRTLLAEPFDTTAESPADDGYFTDDDLVALLHLAELRLVNDLPDDMLWPLLTQQTMNMAASVKLPSSNQPADSVTTSNGTTTTLVDTELGIVDDVYIGRTVRMLSGPAAGETSVVTDYEGIAPGTPGTLTFAPALSAGTTATNLYTFDEQPPHARIHSITAVVGNLGTVTGHLVSYQRFQEAKFLPQLPGSAAINFLCALGPGQTLELWPTPTGPVTMNYFRVPRKRVQFHKGVVDSATVGGNDITDADPAFDDDLWPTATGTGLAFLSGLNNRLQKQVNTFASNKFTVYGVFPSVPAAGDEYVVGELSELPEIVAPAKIAYAGYLALTKDKDEVAGRLMQDYVNMIQSFGGRYLGSNDLEDRQ